MSIKTAVIGVGSMGKNHARVYWEMPDVKLVGISDVNETMSGSIAKQYSSVSYKDYQQMLDEQKPDAVTICVPTSLHVEIGLEVIKRGIHLLVEKPISCTVDEGILLIDAAEKAGVKLMIGHIERFNPAITMLKGKLANGKLGKVFKVEARREGPIPQRINDVGVVIDLAVHDLDIIRYVTQKEITRVYAETTKGIHSKYEDLMSGLIYLSDGTVGNLIINWITPAKIREFSVTGELGMFKVNYITQDLFFYENSLLNQSEWATLGLLRGVGEGSIVHYHVNKKEPLRAEQEAFLAAIRDDTVVPVTGQDGLHALELAQALVTSGNENRLVFLNHNK